MDVSLTASLSAKRDSGNPTSVIFEMKLEGHVNETGGAPGTQDSLTVNESKEIGRLENVKPDFGLPVAELSAHKATLSFSDERAYGGGLPHQFATGGNPKSPASILVQRWMLFPYSRKVDILLKDGLITWGQAVQAEHDAREAQQAAEKRARDSREAQEEQKAEDARKNLLEQETKRNESWERANVVQLVVGLLLTVFVGAIVFRYGHRFSRPQMEVARALLALGGGFLGSAMSGFLLVKVEFGSRLLIQAGGGLAVFIVMYRWVAKTLPQPRPPRATSATQGSLGASKKQKTRSPTGIAPTENLTPAPTPTAKDKPADARE